MYKSYSQQTLGLHAKRNTHSVIGFTNQKISSLPNQHHAKNPSTLMTADKYQNWKFFNPQSVTINSHTLQQENLTKTSSKAVLSPVKGGVTRNKNSLSKANINFSNAMLNGTSQNGINHNIGTEGKMETKQSYQQQALHKVISQNPSSMTFNINNTQSLQQTQQSGQDTLQQPVTTKKRRRGQMKGSFVDHILEAAQQTQQEEMKDFFLTHVQSESILPPINLNDKKEYKSLMHRQKEVSYLVSKHVRLANERSKYGKVENNHYQHYERLEPIESVLQKVKPSEKTMNYQPKLAALEKPSLELMKSVNKKLLQEREQNGNDPITHEFIQDTYQTFGMNNEDIDDVNAIVAEEDDKVDFAPKEIKFTEHQLEFKNICSKVNKEKSAEIFIKTNKDFSKWNLRDKNAVTYFLSRAAHKEPRNFIEKEIEERQQQNDEFYYRKPVQITKVENQEGLEQDMMPQPPENDQQQDNQNNYSEDYEYYSETERRSMPDQQFRGSYTKLLETSRGHIDRNLLDVVENPSKKHRRHYSSMSAGGGGRARNDSNSSSRNSKQSKMDRQVLSEQEDKIIEEEKKKEEDELKKFIFLEKLKYEKAIKGYDRMPGMKANLDEFTEVLMHKLFKKREPTNEFKYILKKDNTHNRVDHSKPLYMDDLKRFGKLKDECGRKKLSMIEHQATDIKRDYQEINIFNMDLDEEFKDPEKLKRTLSLKKFKSTIQQQQQKKPEFSGAWYLPVSKWGNIQKYNYDQREVFKNKEDKILQEQTKIGELTKQALQYLLNPYQETSVKRMKLLNKDEIIHIKPKEKHYVELPKDIKDKSHVDDNLQK